MDSGRHCSFEVNGSLNEHHSRTSNNDKYSFSMGDSLLLLFSDLWQKEVEDDNGSQEGSTPHGKSHTKNCPLINFRLANLPD